MMSKAVPPVSTAVAVWVAPEPEPLASALYSAKLCSAVGKLAESPPRAVNPLPATVKMFFPGEKILQPQLPVCRKVACGGDGVICRELLNRVRSICGIRRQSARAPAHRQPEAIAGACACRGDRDCVRTPVVERAIPLHAYVDELQPPAVELQSAVLCQVLLRLSVIPSVAVPVEPSLSMKMTASSPAVTVAGERSGLRQRP